MEILSLDEVLEKVLNRELSVRQASKTYGYSRDVIRAELNRKYSNDKEKMDLVAMIMQENKEKASTIPIESEVLEEIFFKVINKEMTIKEAQIALGNIDIQTIKEKFGNFVLEVGKEEIAQRYLEFNETQNSDYSKINFRIIAIQMMRKNLSQIEMADKLGMHPRSLSREFEKLKKDKDTRLYDLLKSYSFLKMKRHKFTDREILILDKLLTDYEMKNQNLLKDKQKSKLEIAIEREDYLVSEAERLKKQGLTQAEIAKKLQTSVSTLRRAKISKEKRDKLKTESYKNVDDEVK